MTVMMHLSALRTPSSGPSGHLLPAGEKRKDVATSPFPATVAVTEILGLDKGRAQRRRDRFSPAGRRWRVAPDEGAPKASDPSPRIEIITIAHKTWGETI